MKALLSVTLICLIGCSSPQSQQSLKLHVQKKWIQSTLNGQYLGPQIINPSSPLILENMIVSSNPVDGVASFDKKTGNRIWKNTIKNGVTSGLTKFNDLVIYAANDGQVYAVKANSGKVVWTFPTQTETLSQPVIDEKNLYLLASNGNLFSLEASTGKLNWSYFQRDNSAMSIRSSSSPVIDGNLLYIGFSDGTLAAFDKTNGFLKWERSFSGAKNRFKDLDSTPVVSGDHIYVTTFSGGLFCLKKSSGDIIWQNEDGSASGVVVAANKLFYSSASNSIIALDASTGKQIWSYKVKAGIASRPLLHKELVIAGTSSGPVVVLSALNGEYLAEYSTGWGVSSQATVDSETQTLYVSSNYGYLYALHLEWLRPSQQWPWEKI